MKNIEWDCVRPLKNETEVNVLELKYIFQLPEDLKNCIKENNGGIPYPCSFNFGVNKGKTFGGLLSFNKEDVDNIHDVLSLFETPDKNRLRMFPFGIDPAGNFFCVKDREIVLYNHETEKIYPICKTFTEFINMLYEE